ncbi:MAG: hypothetical protein ACI9F9_003187, partial [Candidatus Paceibacteria bacterium]
MSPVPLKPVAVTERTAGGPGGVSVLTLQGAGAFDLLSTWGVACAESGALRFAQLEVDGERVDEVLICVHSPQEVELHVHGSPPLVRRLLEAARGREAPNSVLVLEDRARLALAKAPCELAARVLLDQVEGAWRRECEQWLALPTDALPRALEDCVQRSDRLRWALEPARVLIA